MSEQDAWFYRMKAAQRDLIARCGGIEPAARIGKVSVPQMGRLNNVGADDLMSARVKGRLEHHAGEPIVSRVEVEALGWVVAVETPRDEPRPELHVATARVVAEASDVMGAYAQGMKDGRLSPAEVQLIQAELSALARVVEDARLSGAALLALAGGLNRE